MGVAIELAGLSFQVITLTVFIVLAIDYALRYIRFRNTQMREERVVVATRFKVFLGFLVLAIACTLIGCTYQIDELSDGYSGAFDQ